MYRALDQSGYKLRPDVERRMIYVSGSGVPAKSYTLSFLFTGAIATSKSVTQINSEWKTIADEACNYGTEKHNVLEQGIKGFYKEYSQSTQVTSEPYDLKIETLDELDSYTVAGMHETILKLLRDCITRGYTLYAEYRVYSVDHLVSGTIDLVAINAQGEFLIIDWKTNKDTLKFKSGYFKKVWNATRTNKVNTTEWIDKDEKLLAPLGNLPNCKGSLYGLQLALYAALLEMWGLIHKSSILCHIQRMVTNSNEPIFKEDGTHNFHNPIYYQFSNTDYKDSVKLILSKQLNKW
jgi:hypothetical protein